MIRRASLLLVLPALALASCALDMPPTSVATPGRAATTVATTTPAASTAVSSTSAATAAAGGGEVTATPGEITTVTASASSSPDAATSPATATSTAAAGTTTTCTYQTAGPVARPVDPPSGTDVAASGTSTMTLTMNEGPVTVTLDRGNAPCTVNSFESLAKQGFYDGVQCHRLTESGLFILQCGDPTGTGAGGPGYQFADELSGSETYPAGTVAMANAGAGTGTNGSQFFFVYADTQLRPEYTVFGKLDEASLGVITRIADMGTKGGSGEGRPINEARIQSITAG